MEGNPLKNDSKYCFFSTTEEFVNNKSVNTAESLNQEENNLFDENKTWPVSADEDAVFRATVSNMKPEEVFKMLWFKIKV